ncbi:MAG: GH3 auxin-responsive promoter family protein [Bacteroidota bacterium]
MTWKSTLLRPFAKYIARSIDRWAVAPIAAQERVFAQLMSGVAQTTFGKDHGLTAQTTYADFKTKVPLRDYEALKPYIELIKPGDQARGHLFAPA